MGSASDRAREEDSSLIFMHLQATRVAAEAIMFSLCPVAQCQHGPAHSLHTRSFGCIKWACPVFSCLVFYIWLLERGVVKSSASRLYHSGTGTWWSCYGNVNSPFTFFTRFSKKMLYIHVGDQLTNFYVAPKITNLSEALWPRTTVT